MSEIDSESGLTSHRAPDIARALCAHALIWAHTLASTTRRDPVTFESPLLEEIIAYCLCLLELRCAGLQTLRTAREGRIRLEALMAKMTRGCPRPAALQDPPPIPTLKADERS